MAAWDNVLLPRAPEAPSYMPPNLAPFLQQSIGNLPQDYVQGQQQQAQLQFLKSINQYLQPGAMGGGGPPTPDPYAVSSATPTSLSQAVLQQESGNRDNIADSGKGAIGPGQIMPGTFAQYAQRGEDIRDPQANRAVSNRILSDYMQRYGDPARALVAYFSGPGNVAPPGSPTPWKVDKSDGNVRTSQYVQQTLARMNGGAPQRVASADPSFVPGGAQGSADATPDAGTQPAAETAVAQNTPQQVAQGPTAAPRQGSTSAAATLVPPQYRNDPRAFVQRLDDTIRRLSDQVSQQEKGPKIKMGPIEIDTAKTEGLKAKIDQYKGLRDKILDALKTENEPTGEIKNARASGYNSPQEAALGAKAGEGEVKAGQEMYQSIKETAIQHQRDLKPILDLGKSIVNDPKFYSGSGGERVLDFNRMKAALGGDPRGAQLQEMFGKLRSQNVLQIINNQKTQMSEMGQQAGRMYAQTVETIEKAIPGLETSKNGVRALLEIESRIGDFKGKIFDLANNYLAEQRQRGIQHPYLDQGFDKRLADFVRKNQPFNDKELAHPETLGAPTAPTGLRTTQDIRNWGVSLGLKSGDAIRAPDGRVVALP